jgi:hypothetical protein
MAAHPVTAVLRERLRSGSVPAARRDPHRVAVAERLAERALAVE